MEGQRKKTNTPREWLKNTKAVELVRSLATPNGVLRVTPQLHGWEGRGGDGMTRKRYMMGNTTVGSKKKDIALMKKPK